MQKLEDAGAIHFAVEVRWQRRFYRSRELGLGLLAKSQIDSLLCVKVSFQLCNFILHVLQQLYQLLHISRWLASHIDILMTRGGYCNVAQDSSIHRIPKCTQNQNDTPETKCRVLKLTLCNYTRPMVMIVPQTSGIRLGIDIPMWAAYASQQGSCNAVLLLCSGLAVQGASPYKSHLPSAF